MGKKTPSAPPAPDPKVTAAAQTASNKETALWEAALNRVNQVTPGGTLNYAQTGGGKQYNMDAYNQSMDAWNKAGAGGTGGGTALSYEEWMQRPELMQQYNTGNYNTYKALAEGGGSGGARGAMPKMDDFLIGDLPPSYTATTALTPVGQKSFDAQQRVELGANELAEDQIARLVQALSKPYDYAGLPKAPGIDDFSADRDKVTQGIIDRNQPMMDRSRAAQETQLTNQGLARGSEAWRNASDDLARQENDFRLAALNAGGAEQNRLFGLGSTARQQAIQELTAQRSQPINEIAALLGTGQVAMPQFANSPQTGLANTDTTGPANLAYQAQLANWNAKNQSNQATQGGLFGLAGSVASALPWSSWLGPAAVAASDVRLKKDIRHVGFERGIPVYHFRYIADPQGLVWRGVMAQEVQEIAPEAVEKIGGYLAVDYGKIGIEFGRVH